MKPIILAELEAAARAAKSAMQIPMEHTVLVTQAQIDYIAAASPDVVLRLCAALQDLRLDDGVMMWLRNEYGIVIDPPAEEKPR